MKPRLVDTTGNKYTLLVSTGMYSSDSFIGLLWEMLKHRFYHLREHGIWMD